MLDLDAIERQYRQLLQGTPKDDFVICTRLADYVPLLIRRVRELEARNSS